jgi:DNA-binding transcriptional MerR regulator
MTGSFKTPVVAKILGVPVHRLNYLLKSGKIQAPSKDSSGDYSWDDLDVERARAALDKRKGDDR